MIAAGVTSDGPSHVTPSHGSRNVLEPMPKLYDPGSTFLKVYEPSAALVTVPIRVPSAAANSTVIPGNPSSSLSTTPFSFAPGFVSLQMTPEIVPGSRVGATASTAPEERPSSGMRTKPTFTIAPPASSSTGDVMAPSSPTGMSVEGIAPA